jgi:hypothetical protein
MKVTPKKCGAQKLMQKIAFQNAKKRVDRCVHQNVPLLMKQTASS